MSNKSLLLAMGTVVLFSCSKLESEPQVLPEAPIACSEFISIPIVNETVATNEEETKAYYYETPSYWTYVWELNDSFNYFNFSGNDLIGAGTANVIKSSTNTLVSYAASGLEVGNRIYSYFLQRDLWQNEIENNDPNAVKLVIPNNQVTTKDPEQFRDEVDCALSISGLSLSNQSAEGDAGIANMGNVKIPDNVLNFKIENYNPAFTYKCKADSDEGGIDDFSVDSEGNASVTVEFDAYPTGAYTQSTRIKVYNGGFSTNYVLVTVSATRTNNKGTKLEGRISKYTAEITGSGAGAGYLYSDGSSKPYPLRDAMPCASMGKLITSSLLKYPEDIANSMTMYMLGAAIEFRVYAPSIHTGEKLVAARVTTTNKPCAGYCYYDLVGQSLTLTGFEDTDANHVITSYVKGCNYTVPAVKGGEESIYVVIAPGTYSGRIEIITEDANGDMWSYRFSISNKSFTRANRKPFSINLDSATPVAFDGDFTEFED